MKQVKIRIVNKSKDGITLDLKKQGIQKFSWQDFNKIYDIVDKVYAVAKPEYQEKFKIINEKIDDCVLLWFQIQAAEKNEDHQRQVVLAAKFGDIVSEITELGPLTPDEVTGLIKDAIQEFKKNMNNPNILKETPQEYKARKSKENKDWARYTSGNIGSATESLANVKGADKLRELFKR